MAADFPKLIEVLCGARVDFVIIGGVAVVAHGYPRSTVDLDVCYARDRGNLERLVSAIAPLRPELRGGGPGLPFLFDLRTLKSGLNFTLTTTAGDLDLLGEVTGVGGFEAVARDALELALYGHTVKVMDLKVLEQAKRAAGRAKDLIDLAALAEIRKRKG